MTHDDVFKRYSWLTPYVFFALFFLIVIAGYAHFAESNWLPWSSQQGTTPEDRLTFSGASSQDSQEQQPTTQQSTQQSSETSNDGCPDDLLRCPSGVYVERNPGNDCRFYDCPQGEDDTTNGGGSSSVPVCPSGTKECPDGTTLHRDPNNNCLFPSCPPIIGMPCDGENPCPNDYVCEEGTCVVDEEEVACTSVSDCPQGQDCIGGECSCGAPNCNFITQVPPCGDLEQGDVCPQMPDCELADELTCESQLTCGEGTTYDDGYCCPEGYEPDLRREVCTSLESSSGCQRDVKYCPDGTMLIRDGDNNCEFPECPSLESCENDRDCSSNSSCLNHPTNNIAYCYADDFDVCSYECGEDSTCRIDGSNPGTIICSDR